MVKEGVIMARKFRIAVAGALLAAASITPIGAQSAQAASQPYCGIWWGSLPKTSMPTARPNSVTGVRTGRHTCYDRVVFDIAGPVSGYHVSYVPMVYQEGRGTPLPVRGAADIRLVVYSPAYNDMGQSTYYPANPNELATTSGYRTFRQLRYAGSFEGQTSIALGVRGRLPMRAFLLSGPGGNSRVVVDVAHRW